MDLAEFVERASLLSHYYAFLFSFLCFLLRYHATFDVQNPTKQLTSIIIMVTAKNRNKQNGSKSANGNHN